MKRKIGLNVVMTFPWCLGFGGLSRAIDLAEAAGYDGLQILPLRGWSAGDFEGVDPKMIIAIEDAWNCGPLWRALARQAGLAADPAPVFHDWLLFGSTRRIVARRLALMRAIFPEAMLSAHDWHDQGPIEMHPEVGFSIEEYAVWPHGLVWDTEHVLRMGRHGEAPVTDDWRELFAQVSGNIRLIHFKNGADPEMLRTLAEATDCPIILETMPPSSFALRPYELAVFLDRQRQFIGKYFY